MKKCILVMAALSLLVIWPGVSRAAVVSPGVGLEKKLIKLANYPGVYLLTADGVKHLFPNRAVYKNWYGDDFSGLKTLTKEEFDNIPYGKNLTVKSGSYFKFDMSDVVYVAGEGDTACRTNSYNGDPYILQVSFMADYNFTNCAK